MTCKSTDQNVTGGLGLTIKRMTVEKCATACASFTKYGVEYGRECYCGNKLNDGSATAEESDCSFDCPGDASQKCGAGNRLNVYSKPASEAPPPTSEPKTYTSKGCYSEPQNSRALAAKTFNSAVMTVEVCAAGCAGYAYFGLEYYHECYCGNFIAAESSELTTDKCNFPCDGDSEQKCGGDWALNMYGFDSSTSTTSSASTSPTAPAFSFTADGCYTEALGQRALTGATYFDDYMTIAKCEAICSSYSIFGVEYGREVHQSTIKLS